MVCSRIFRIIQSSCLASKIRSFREWLRSKERPRPRVPSDESPSREHLLTDNRQKQYSFSWKTSEPTPSLLKLEPYQLRQAQNREELGRSMLKQEIVVYNSLGEQVYKGPYKPSLKEIKKGQYFELAIERKKFFCGELLKGSPIGVLKISEHSPTTVGEFKAVGPGDIVLEFRA